MQVNQENAGEGTWHIVGNESFPHILKHEGLDGEAHSSHFTSRARISLISIKDPLWSLIQGKKVLGSSRFLKRECKGEGKQSLGVGYLALLEYLPEFCLETRGKLFGMKKQK